MSGSLNQDKNFNIGSDADEKSYDETIDIRTAIEQAGAGVLDDPTVVHNNINNTLTGRQTFKAPADNESFSNVDAIVVEDNGNAYGSQIKVIADTGQFAALGTYNSDWQGYGVTTPNISQVYSNADLGLNIISDNDAGYPGGTVRIGTNEQTGGWGLIINSQGPGGPVEIGFLGAIPVIRQAVTGSRANPAEALASLLTALESLGLIDDQTTA